MVSSWQKRNHKKEQIGFIQFGIEEKCCQDYSNRQVVNSYSHRLNHDDDQQEILREMHEYINL